MANVVVMPIARRAKAFQKPTEFDSESLEPREPIFDEAERVKPVRVVVDGLAGFQRRNVAFALREWARERRHLSGSPDRLSAIVFDELAEEFEK